LQTPADTVFRAVAHLTRPARLRSRKRSQGGGAGRRL